MSIRVLCADDSEHVLNILCRLLSSDDDIEIAGRARDGGEAVEMAKRLKPDVITLDLKMPGINGLEALKILKKQTQIPVIMISSYTQYGAKTTLECLEYGAADFIPKPATGRSDDLLKLKDELIGIVKALSRSSNIKDGNAKVGEISLPDDVSDSDKNVDIFPECGELTNLEMNCFDLVAIGGSTGGPMAVTRILGGLPASFPWPVVVVQHMPEYFTEFFVEKLNTKCRLNVREVEDREVIKGKTIYVTPGDHHITLKRIEDEMIFSLDNPGMSATTIRPSIDLFFKSVSDLVGDRAVGILLSGMGCDGADGLLKLKENGAVTIAQDRNSSIVYGMPGRAIELGAVSYVIELRKIPFFIYSLARKIASLKC